MKVGDLVKLTSSARWNLRNVSRQIGIIVELRGQCQNGIVYVSWADRSKPTPISTRWLEVIL